MIADLRFGQLLESVVWTIKHDVGDSLEHAAGHVFRCALVGALVLWFGLTGAGIAYLVQGLGASYLAGLDPMVSGGLVLALIAIFGLISAPVIRALL